MRRIIEDGLKKKPPRRPTADQLAKLQGEPEVDGGTVVLARAYAELSSCKPLGFAGRGPIPWTAMVMWCQLHGLSRPVMSHAIQTLRQVDNIFLRREAEKSKTKPPATRGRRR